MSLKTEKFLEAVEILILPLIYLRMFQLNNPHYHLHFAFFVSILLPKKQQQKNYDRE